MSQCCIFVDVSGRLTHPLINNQVMAKESIEKLADKISSYERAVQGLLDKIHEYSDWVVNNVEIREIQEELQVRRFGKYELVYPAVTVYDDYEGYSEHKPIPVHVSELDGDTYLNGDYNCYVRWASKKEVMEFAKNLNALLEQAKYQMEKDIEVINSVENV